MPDFNPENVRSLVSKVMRASPSDVRLIAQRLHDHAVEERMSPEAARAFVTELGYGSLEAFCADIGLPGHIAERWGRFGVSGEMRQVFTLLAAQRRKMAEAIAEFEAMTHVGIEDFLRERGLL
ncbi:hypothetical protein N7E70_028390 (plasmid) [Aminobacter sp. NyZ550]|uniref:Uncharacterized protein n=2 Tax=Aminobacter TaxID=31988 RepID=A0AAC8YUR7_AMIAI|nr:MULTISPECIES: hypothetical protein [Aminobacter]AMS44842.1 hypothetical protein AA2016_5937 [Aminobacter aminovorans]MBA8908182.1 hypothetical protein [Aminobacter ciceronei]MBA9021834.1 hypothetical protein [Aminobacter ciceronei]MBB3704363.1 hypothetical protein [Aminobacter aminovorans]WAX98505.1 hypothetical protein N7E70_028390 [Aminobacter sp. NyZ550]